MPVADTARLPDARSVDVEALFAEGTLTRLQYAVLALCVVALFIDGSDIYMVGNLGPAIAAGLHIAPASMVSVFVIQQIGLAVGAFLIGPISDRIGRRRVLLACFVAFGVLTIAATFASTLREFAIARGVAGLFMSGVIPNAIALLVETTPRKRRSLFVSLGFAGYAGGAASGALIAAVLVDRFGWQSGFWICGVAPLAFVLLFSRLIPKSVEFLYRRDPADPKLHALVVRQRPALAGKSFVLTQSNAVSQGRVSPFVVLQGTHRLSTLLLWGIFFLSVGTITLSFAWLPTFYNVRANIPLSTYSAVAAVSLIGGMVGTVAVGALMDRFRPVAVVSLFFALAVVALLVLSQTSFGTVAFRIALAIMTLSLSAGQTGTNVIAANVYSVDVRATGVGWAFGMARIGGIVGPAIGGMMLAHGWSTPSFLLGLCVPLVLIALLLMILGRYLSRVSRRVSP